MSGRWRPDGLAGRPKAPRMASPTATSKARAIETEMGPERVAGRASEMEYFEESPEAEIVVVLIVFAQNGQCQGAQKAYQMGTRKEPEIESKRESKWDSRPATSGGPSSSENRIS